MGSIPACAGEPFSSVSVMCFAEVYPRVCGGTYSAERVLRLHRGLSPRVRGNLEGQNPALGDVRSIPACAGEPRGSESGPRRCTVYPRVCGGTSRVRIRPSEMYGLSPRVRGNLLKGIYTRLDSGSIPACAGEPTDPPIPITEVWVYPRVCGGTVTGVAIPQPTGGLSPRVRGNQFPHPAESSMRGSIPACAGEPGG